MSKIDFWKTKHEIDAEIARLGWSVDKCKDYIQKHYNKRSRLVMTDTELLDLLERLRSFCHTKSIPRMSSRARRKRRKRI